MPPNRPTLTLYNTLTRSKEPFAPIDPTNVRMYVCGPTVYDFAHIGNARPVIVFDVLYRLLRHLCGSQHVTYVRNITDVDDKINERAARAARDVPDLPLNEAIARVTATTAEQFHADVAALGCLPPDVEPRATEHIAQMRAIIERLLAGGFAYVAEEHVLFSPAAMDRANGGLPRYGALANRSRDEMIAGARVDVAPYKRDATDFVLWKPSGAGEPAWASPAGIATPGRPGWHIECSAMSWQHLGEEFDIHGGGIDLVFPHHENEIAQSTCAFGHARMANVWMHNGFLQVEGQKMSKSLGNFVTIRELLATDRFGGRSWPGEVLRLAMLKTHYRQPIDWTVKALEEAEDELSRWWLTIANSSAHLQRLGYYRLGHPPEPPAEFIDSLCDDLNTAEGLAQLRKLYSDAAKSDQAASDLLQAGEFLGVMNPERYFALVRNHVFTGNAMATTGENKLITDAQIAFNNGDAARANALKDELSTLGIQVRFENSGAVSYSKRGIDVRPMISARLEARRQKNWAESDRIRDELAAMGIQLKDGKDPATGELITTWEVRG